MEQLKHQPLGLITFHKTNCIQWWHVPIFEVTDYQRSKINGSGGWDFPIRQKLSALMLEPSIRGQVADGRPVWVFFEKKGKENITKKEQTDAVIHLVYLLLQQPIFSPPRN